MSTAEIAPAPFADGPEHLHLRSFVGSWTGKMLLWLDPPNPPDETSTVARVTSLLGGRFVQIDYDGTAMGAPHTGRYTLAYERDEHRFTAAWIDSFHTGTAMMISTAPTLTNPSRSEGTPSRSEGTPSRSEGTPSRSEGNDIVSVLGSYAAGDQRWGWRTTFRIDGGQLVIAAFNITPDGIEAPAFEMQLARA